MNTVEVTFKVPFEKLTEFGELVEQHPDIFNQARQAQVMIDKRIFISYRRADSAYITGRIHDRLAERLGRGSIFRDVDDIAVGSNFTTALERQLETSDMMIVIIGDKWMDITSAETGERRLDNPNDIVRLEVETALDRRIPVIPVLVRGAPFPDRDELPLRMKPLADKSGLVVRPDPDFHPDVDRLIAQIAQILNVQV